MAWTKHNLNLLISFPHFYIIHFIDFVRSSKDHEFIAQRCIDLHNTLLISVF